MERLQGINGLFVCGTSLKPSELLDVSVILAELWSGIMFSLLLLTSVDNEQWINKAEKE